MAEFILKKKVTDLGIEGSFFIASAATSTEEIWNGKGNPVYPPARAELAKHGISCEGKTAVQLKKSDYDEYDYLIFIDPWYSNKFDDTYRDIDEGCDAFLNYLRENGQI